MYEISFPGLGIGEFTIHSVAFTLFGKDIMWYGILICIGMILAYLYAYSRAKFEGIKTDDLLDLGFFVIPVSYTPLDVYKRQSFIYPAAPGP